MEKHVVIFGSSGHARVVLENLLSQNNYKFLGWIDPNESKGAMIFGYPVLGDDNDIKTLYQEQRFMGIIGIGDIHMRKQVAETILNLIPEFEFVNAIHSSAIISPSVKLGNGIAIMPGTIINAESSIGDHSIINTGTQIDHNCKIGNFVNLSPSVIMGGNVNVAFESFIGIGSILSNNLNISEKSMIKAGSVLTKNPG